LLEDKGANEEWDVIQWHSAPAAHIRREFWLAVIDLAVFVRGDVDKNFHYLRLHK
jgi:hypothetical protein